MSYSTELKVHFLVQHLQVLHSLLRVRRCTVHIGFDGVGPVTVLLHRDRHVQEDVVQFQQVLLNHPHGLDHMPAALLPDRFLQECLAPVPADHGLNRFVVCLLPR
jgi:hypothetical protein